MVNNCSRIFGYPYSSGFMGCWHLTEQETNVGTHLQTVLGSTAWITSIVCQFVFLLDCSAGQFPLRGEDLLTLIDHKRGIDGIRIKCLEVTGFRILTCSWKLHPGAHWQWCETQTLFLSFSTSFPGNVCSAIVCECVADDFGVFSN